jgi:hypothetical protein
MTDQFDDIPDAQLGAQTGQAPKGEFDDIPNAPLSDSPGLGQRAATVGAQALGGFGETLSAGSGMALGTALGFKAAPFLGPLAPAGPIVGAAAGLGYGLYAGGKAREGLGIPPVEQLPPNLRPSGYWGESIGSSLSVALFPYGAAATGTRFKETSMVGAYLNQIINTAKTKPLAFGTIEASTAVSAATGAAFAEAVAPGETGVRIVSEVGAAVLNPVQRISDVVSFGGNMIGKVYEAMSPAGRETAAAKRLADILRVTGEDPAAIIAVLRSPDIAGTENLTAAQKSGSFALSAMEQYLAKHSTRFGAESEQRALDGMNAVRMQISELQKTGDPEAMTAAAELLSTYYRALVQTRLDIATEAAVTAAQRVTSDSPATRAQLGKQARDALNSVIKDARKAETELWKLVDGNRQVGFSNLQREFETARAELLPEVRNEKMPNVVTKFLERISKPVAGEESLIILPEDFTRPARAQPVGTNVNEMRQLRSELLEQATVASNAGNYGEARILNRLAESVLEDMDVVFREAGDTTYDAARAFSREFNDTFTRSFAGKATATGRFGDRIAPELLLDRALASGPQATALQMHELEEATRFLVVRGYQDSGAVTDMIDAQERILRLAAANFIDPTTNKVNPAQMNKFIKDYELVLSRFPEVRQNLIDAATTETGRRSMEQLAKNQVDVTMKQKTFSKLLANDPVTLSEKMLISRNQETELLNMIKVAKAGSAPRPRGKEGVRPQDALDGLKASVFEAAIRKSTINNVLDPVVMRDFLFRPSVPGKKSPIDIMRDNGVIDAKQIKDINTLFEVASTIRQSARPGTAVEVKPDMGDAALALLSRAVGATSATAATSQVGASGRSLVIAGGGAKFAETVMTKLPVESTRNVLIQAMYDKKLMETLLMKADTPALQAQQSRQIHAWLVQSGLTSIEEPFRAELSFGLGETEPELFTQPR